MKEELEYLKNEMKESLLYKHMLKRYESDKDGDVYMNALFPACIAEKALIYLFAEQNLIPEELLLKLVNELKFDREYMRKTLSDNRRPVNMDQPFLEGLY